MHVPLFLSAKCFTSQAITIRSSGGLSDSEVEKMVQEAERMREADQRKKDTVQAKNEGETLAYQVECRGL